MNWDKNMMIEAGHIAVKELQAELAAQGHNATGNLSGSIEYEIGVEGDDFVTRVKFEEYGQYVDRGRPAGVRRVPIAALMDWIRQRRFAADGEEEIRRIAFSIQYTIFEEGTPTRGSLRFSKTGKRDEFVQIAQARVVPKVEAAIEKNIEKFIVGEIADAIQSFNQNF